MTDLGHETLVRGLGAIQLAAGILVCLGLVFTPQYVDSSLVIALLVVAFGQAAALVALGRRLPRWVLHLCLNGGAVLVSAGYVASPWEGAGPYTFIYVWGALFAAFAFTLRVALAHTALVAVCTATAFALTPGDDIPRWLLVNGTVLLTVLAVQFVRQRAADLQALLEHGRNFVLVCRPDGRIVRASERAEVVVGPGVGAAHVDSLVHPEDLASLHQALGALLDDPASARSATVRVQAGETWMHAEIALSNHLARPSVRGLVLHVRDVGERAAFEEQLRHQAFHDPLTGLPNRALFADRLQHALERRERTQHTIGVLMFDLDDFKEINDSLGHSVGDELLRTLAERLLAEVRPADTVVRLGGDEFAVLLEDTEGLTEARRVATRLLARLGEPVLLADHLEVRPRASVGVVTSSSSQERGEELLRDADAAMYEAKRQGGNRVACFATGLHEALQRRLRIKTDLERGIDRGELTLRYQPVVRLEDERITGVEALVRWEHPELGLLSPLEFIDVAETGGLIMSLGRFVLNAACDQLVAWQADGVGHDLNLQVNVSGRQLEQPAFVADVVDVLRRTGIEPPRLTLEVTESVLLTDLEAVAERLVELKGVGVQLAIDDFGTGYATLGTLRDHPFDCVKIDKSFVDAMVTSASSSTLVQTIVDLGRSLALSTVAEGVEEVGQVQQLRALRCGYAQGYLFSRPVGADAIAALLVGDDASDDAAADGRCGQLADHVRA